MCGIVGYFGPKSVDLHDAAASILHRGPDMQAIARGRGWQIAFNRLAIIDTSENGMQPFSFDGVTVVLNGEIYNYRELREAHKHEYVCRTGSDVEIVPFLYRKYGIECLQRLNGMFSIALIDERAGRYLLIRDRFGKKPLFYRCTDGAVYFASELKALKRLVPLNPDRTSLALNLLCWLLIQPLTVYEEAFNVKPGHYVEFDGSKVSQHQWYMPRIACAERAYGDIRDSFRDLYRQSIDLRFRSDVPVGIALSGGLDSSSMAYLARAVSAENFIAFTAKIVGKEQLEGSTDTLNPRRLCADLDIPQVSTVVDGEFWNRNIVDIARNYDEVFLNSGTLVFYAIAASARASGVKVLLSGVGGDELFGGYPWQAQMRLVPRSYLRACLRRPSDRLSKRLHAWGSRLGMRGLRGRIVRAHRLCRQFQIWHAQSLCSAFVPYMRDVDDQVVERIEAHSREYFDIATRAVSGDPYNQVHYANIFTVIGNQNHQLDMASMRHSVENRSPMLDVNLVEYFMSVPDRSKNAEGPKSLMRKMLAEFLPRYITSASKSGPTMPLAAWFEQSELGASARSFVRADRNLIGDLLSAELASSLDRDDLYAGQTGAMRTFALTSFLLWAKINVQGTITDAALPFTEVAAAGL
jgi:asparagine synthase (glutamine-hydrolysing)